MPTYKGRRSHVTFPPAIYELIAELAETETKTVSMMVVTLCEEALKARNIEVRKKE